MKSIAKKLDPDLLKILATPMSQNTVIYNEDKNLLISMQDGLSFPVVNGVPHLLLENALFKLSRKMN
jgi:uncharacterized protein YbaR (Trm112 family)